MPHLERHQAWLLLRGIKYYKDYETYGLAASGTFNYYIYPDILREVNDLFQKKLEPPKGFVSVFAHLDVFYKYNLPDFIPDHPNYIHHVLPYEAVTKIIMDLEKCSYEMATGIGLGLNGPTKTPYGLDWDILIEERNQRREVLRREREAREKSRRKQKTPRKVTK